MADEQKTDTIEETAPVEQAIEQKEEEKTFNLKQNDLERIIQKRIAQERSSLEKKYSGIDPEEAKKLKQEKEEQEVERKKQRGEFEDLLKEQADKFNQEKSQMQKQLEQIKINDALVNSSVKNKAINPEQVTNLLKGKVKATPFKIADLDMTNPDDRKRYAEYKKERDGKPSVINLT